MKQIGYLFLLIISITLLIEVSYAENHQEKGIYTFLFTYPPVMEIGAENVHSVNRIINRYGDDLFKKVSFGENYRFTKIVGISKRLLKMSLLEFPVSEVALVVQHEIFGHTVRALEFDCGITSININLPPPYGKGGGSVYISSGKDLSVDKHILIFTGGPESNIVYSQMLEKKFLKQGYAEYYELPTYLFNIEIAKLLFGSAGNLNDSDFRTSDDGQYLVKINSKYLGTETDINSYKITPEKLRKDRKFKLYHPMVYIAMCNYLINYIYKGKERMEIPMIRIRNVDFFPTTEFHMTPFGNEYYINVYLKTLKNFIDIYGRIGDRTFTEFWGLGVTVDNILQTKHFILDGRVDFWRQPPVTNGQIPEKNASLMNGLNINIDSTIPLERSDFIDVRFILGYKTEGFLIGKPLSKGFYGGVGLDLRF